MVYEVIMYPMNVISTNRIMQTTLARDSGENLNNELRRLMQVNTLGSGLFRGLLLGLVL